ncbi:MAG: glycosyltransferase family 2 protein [Sinimarinibacterium sp.]|jgi:glycosyltransferase involved in cell wall biosynthesis
MTTSAAPLVSIIVPSYNQGRFIGQTLDTIFAQDYRPLEVIVVDGASTDETVDVLKAYAQRHPELRWISEPDRGVADAVNKGLALARGRYVGIQSSDDLYRPGAVSEAVTLFEVRPQVGLVCADAEIIDERGNYVRLAPCRLPYTQARFLARSTVIHQSSAFFRLEVAQKVGGWNARYFCADTEMWLRMSFCTEILKVDRVWSAWRRHEAQRDKEKIKMWEAWGRMIAENEDLRRAPLRLRLAASAGRRLVALSYNPRSRWFVTVQAWLAVLTYPPSYAGVFNKAALFPGLGRLSAIVARLSDSKHAASI